MPGGKYGTKQVYDDDFDYDDYLDDGIEDDEESETPSKAASLLPGTSGASTVLPSMEPSAQEYDEFISELLGEEGVEEQVKISNLLIETCRQAHYKGSRTVICLIYRLRNHKYISRKSLTMKLQQRTAPSPACTAT